MGDRLPVRVALLALLHGCGGLFCLAAALWPMRTDSPVALSWILGVLGLVIQWIAIYGPLGLVAILATLSKPTRRDPSVRQACNCRSGLRSAT